MRAIRPLILVLCLGGCLALIGCEQPQPMTDFGPQLDTEGVPRSLALDTPLLQHLRETRGIDRGQAWYDARNDQTLAATSGYELPTVQSSVTYTRDRQYFSNGRVYDNVSSTTYRAEYRQIVR